ncbi:MAG: EscU/YscU/HrcU family type III secretion system export apparatus switch protein [Verrucomicrobia bacterium]|nr:MAG: EscU/YscU/HrcU family type III secretion system export apparatus switch protein [Verrucomicrobiota bacterium]
MGALDSVMSGQESSSEKTEQPTPKRIQDAREKGQVAKSTEVVMTISGAVILATVCFTSPYLKLWLEDLFRAIFQAMADDKRDPTIPCLQLAVKVVCFAAAPVALASVISVILANVAQFGFLLSFQPLKPEITKLNPVEGLKRIFSMKTLFEFAKSVVKILVLGVAVIWAIRLFIGQLVLLPFEALSGLMQCVSHIFIFFCAVILLIWILLSIVDFLMQKRMHTKQLMMTLDEVKRENKETEGNPEIKQTRKGIHREIIFEDSAANTKQSTVLVTNPTHYAAAIYYCKGETPLPVLKAKGMGTIAMEMISIAQREGIPIIENVALARALYQRMRIFEMIPYDLLEPVAEILRWISMLPSSKPN